LEGWLAANFIAMLAYHKLYIRLKEAKKLGKYSPKDIIEMSKAIKEDGSIAVSTAAYFDFSENFVKNYAPKTIELGRSWVQPNYQPSVNPRKGIFALDNIWDGLGAIVVMKKVEYFFGKVTMYPNYNPQARDFLLYFMNHFFPDTENLMKPKSPKGFFGPTDEFEKLISGTNYQEGFKILNQYVRNLNEHIPPLVNIYMGLSPTMKTFGTANNSDFGDVEETGILVTIADIHLEKKERHINTYSASKG
jgi:hypothetical protein